MTVPGLGANAFDAGYAETRRTDPRLREIVDRLLGGTDSVVNVGCGSGSYEPPDKFVIGLDPSRTMLSQRGGGISVRAVAEDLPLRSKSVSGVLAVHTLHHWKDWRLGLDEVCRVGVSRVVIITQDPDCEYDFWLERQYLPQLLDEDWSNFPAIGEITEYLNDGSVRPFPLPWDFEDGIYEAFWRRPQQYLNPRVRRNISAFARIGDRDLATAMQRLENDITTGRWSEQNADLVTAPEKDYGYVVISGTPR
ncbi:class I SAM-dependent methyltransferase [Candidatus Saccharibacteria bacterium]|nr:class I SAM-dependent methyltransferase [Candidatus Saccharibacteria bacterium]